MEKAQRDFVNFEGSGMGFLEMSHRDAGGPVQQCLEELCEHTRNLLKVPSNYQILLFQSGAHGQFAGVPLNLQAKKASYVLTGAWSEKAANEASAYCDVRVASDSATLGHRAIAPASEWAIRPDDDYVYVCGNETIAGLEVLTERLLDGYPADGPPLVADMTSTLLSRPMDVSKYGVIFASSGKNLGPAGLCVVIVRDDLIHRNKGRACPSVLDWAAMADSQPIPNIYNTPPTFVCHMTRLTLRDLVASGGLEWAQARGERRAKLLYDTIDASDGFYVNEVDPAFRSRVNVPFRLAPERFEAEFVAEAHARGLQQVIGHPLFGGQRVTLYNGIPDMGVLEMAKFMRTFQHAREEEVHVHVEADKAFC